MIAELNEMRLLVVDDDVDGAALVVQILHDAGYENVLTVHDPYGTRQVCTVERPEVVLLSLQMSADRAFGVLQELRPLTGEPESLPVLALASPEHAEARLRALSMGAHDSIAVPIDRPELLQRVRNVLVTRQLRQQLRDGNALLSESVLRRASELETACLESLSVLAAMSEYHDDDTFQHTQRVGAIAAMIARAMELPESYVATLRAAAPLHDIGKVGISRRIFLKPGKLTPAEWTHMTRHVEIGAGILSAARSPALALAAEIALSHHERWDGSGYLGGLQGESIPISGRIAAVADVYDVITHDRPYRTAWDIDRALHEISSQSGRQFDPRVVDAFAAIDVRSVADLLTGEEVHAV